MLGSTRPRPPLAGGNRRCRRSSARAPPSAVAAGLAGEAVSPATSLAPLHHRAPSWSSARACSCALLARQRAALAIPMASSSPSRARARSSLATRCRPSHRRRRPGDACASAAGRRPSRRSNDGGEHRRRQRSTRDGDGMIAFPDRPSGTSSAPNRRTHRRCASARCSRFAAIGEWIAERAGTINISVGGHDPQRSAHGPLGASIRTSVRSSGCPLAASSWLIVQGVMAHRLGTNQFVVGLHAQRRWHDRPDHVPRRGRSSRWCSPPASPWRCRCWPTSRSSVERCSTRRRRSTCSTCLHPAGVVAVLPHAVGTRAALRRREPASRRRQAASTSTSDAARRVRGRPARRTRRDLPQRWGRRAASPAPWRERSRFTALAAVIFGELGVEGQRSPRRLMLGSSSPRPRSSGPRLQGQPAAAAGPARHGPGDDARVRCTESPGLTTASPDRSCADLRRNGHAVCRDRTSWRRCCRAPSRPPKRGGSTAATPERGADSTRPN